ncbi:MAG: heparinase II/III family protein, partial [Candidatus Alcyoniella australis]|nr:heparinase II/III family protein [Candidatus Alcyoniella australis]
MTPRSSRLLLLILLLALVCLGACDADSNHDQLDHAPDDDHDADDDDSGADDDLGDDDDAPWDPDGPWNPELTGHPRLEFGPEDLARLRERATAEPHSTLLDRLRSKAARNPRPRGDFYDASLEYDYANVCRAAAFVYLIDGDQQLRDKALQMLLELATELVPPDLEMIMDDIHVAEAIQGWVFAADYLLDDPALSDEQRELIRWRLGRLGENFFDLMVRTAYPARMFNPNNHEIKTACALGLLAMLLPDHPDSRRWINYAATAVDLLCTVQTTDGGADGTDVGWAEGPYYYMYTTVNLLPFWAAYQRLVGEDRTWHLRSCDFFGNNCRWEPYEVVNYLDNPRWLELNLWALSIRMPDGLRPALDDSLHRNNFGVLLAALYDEPLFAWDWLTSPAHPWFTIWCADLAADIYTLWDGRSEPPAATFGPSFYFPEAGNAVFRSDWSQGAVYGFFIAEHGRIREHGYSHEHADGLSLIVHAHGELFAIDSGYGDYSQHDELNQGRDHNLILVDQIGPAGPNRVGYGGDDAFLDRWFDLGALQYARGSSSYAGVQIERHVAFVDRARFVVFDRVASDQQHDYDLLWHLLAGGDTANLYSQRP